MEAYLDFSATTPVCQQAADAILEQCRRFGNPSSLHQKGLEAEITLQECRAAVAKRIGCAPEEVVFTSGGTEGNNLAIFGAAAANRRKGNRIVTTAVEHASVLEPCKELERQGFDVVFLKPGRDGCVPPEAFLQAVDSTTILVSVMACNNETGALQPVEAAAKAIKCAGAPALLHCDGVQSFCKLPFYPLENGVDLFTVSSHKIYGPKGAGALMVRKGVRIIPRCFGGPQEKGLRPGTENMPGIAGFAAAAKAMPGETEQLSKIESLRAHLLWLLENLPGVEINAASGSPYITNISIPGVPAEVMLHFLEERGVFVSTGSACKKGAASHVLSAMGVPKARVDGALRVSLGYTSAKSDVEALTAGLKEGLSVLCRKRR